MKRILPEWESYRREVIPPNAHEIQVEECRRAFYAGAVSLFTAIQRMLSPDADPTAEDIQKMEDLKNELLEYEHSLLMQYGSNKVVG